MSQVEVLPSESDEALAARARAGERPAEAALVRRLYPGVHALAARMLRNPEAARDAAQEAFLRAFSRLGQFDGAYRFSAWLFRILVNLIRDEARRGRIPSIDADPDDSAASATSPSDAAIREEEVDRVRSQIAALPESLRLPVLLHFQEGLNGREVAYSLGITPLAARLKICRGVARLRARLEEDP
ncbi:MAG TPA: sigma-70 family RNA polymerase sigma factor [Planctomycetota bacterium]|nr:sigma-70 family RNA polymerase sigma factor [Planctomycetota bacterium]